MRKLFAQTLKAVFALTCVACGQPALAESTPGQASNPWQLLGEFKSRTYYMNRANIWWNNHIATVWTKAVMSKMPVHGVSVLLVFGDNYCNARTITLRALVGYDGGGQMLQRKEIPTSQQHAQNVIPDSVEEFVFDAVCTSSDVSQQ